MKVFTQAQTDLNTVRLEKEHSHDSDGSAIVPESHNFGTAETKKRNGSAKENSDTTTQIYGSLVISLSTEHISTGTVTGNKGLSNDIFENK